jgi:hypothetical protein
VPLRPRRDQWGAPEVGSPPSSSSWGGAQIDDDKIHEAIWDLFKIALLVDEPSKTPLTAAFATKRARWEHARCFRCGRRASAWTEDSITIVRSA